MTRRVLMNQSGFKVSKPGHDVVSAAPLNLQFSSDFAQMAHYQTGELDCDWNENPFRTYSFSKTFPSPPIVRLPKFNSAGARWVAGAVGHLYWEWRYDWVDLDGNSNTAQHIVNTYVTSSAIMIQSINFSTKPAQYTPPLFRLRYTVLDYNA